ncbi:XAC2610-related protein [Emticicia sp. BO119]|uniref:XAC2610-related protein n=1 Tax=Emticicia sp. BO119 TaxID=2757768 RepID=UPI0015F087CD|nr:hypothetical protein [Emticicia sp. BO119]MBA4849547.1 hypothetical protein [Emticicia sp. BO119]
MKPIFSILLLGLILFIGSCAQEKSNDNAMTVKIDSVLPGRGYAKPLNDVNLKQEDEEISDSLHLNNILQKALSIAQKNSSQINFTGEFETKSDTFGLVRTRLSIGYFFSKRYKHLIVNRENPGGDRINIYHLNSKKVQTVLFYIQSERSYVKDILQDVNGDGYKDFVVDLYGKTGCCLKTFNEVYLYLPETGRFSGRFEFINPTYSPKEKVIRGVGYGQPGETEMYKYKWNGLKIDTIEFIYPDEKHKGYYIKSNTLPEDKKRTKIIRLKKVPKEYIRIYGYDWFMYPKD